MSIEIVTTSDFDRDVTQLRRRFRRINQDIKAMIDEIVDSGYRGARMSGYGKALYKVCLTNRFARRGKSGGFRAIYHPLDDHNCLFFHIYSKSDKGDVGASEMRKLLRDLN